jgi:PhnB protein
MKTAPSQSHPLIQAYLFFGGRCEEALEFYKTAIGADVTMMMRFRESPDPAPPGMVPEGWENKIMHAEFRVGTTVVMVSDGCEPGESFSGFALSVSVASEAAADTVFAALSKGGKITMPLGKTFWSPRFGMLTDRFGINWMVNVATC